MRFIKGLISNLKNWISFNEKRSRMAQTKQEIKRIEDQIADLQSIVNKYYKDQKAIEIIEKEEELLGKAFKKTVAGITTYFKPISLIEINAPYQCHGLRFELPLNLQFDKKGRFRMTVNTDFDYIFDNDLILYMDTESIVDLQCSSYEMITEDEFDAALANLMYQVGEASKKYHTLKSIYGAEYDKKIRNLIREGDNNEEKKE